MCSAALYDKGPRDLDVEESRAVRYVTEAVGLAKRTRLVSSQLKMTYPVLGGERPGSVGGNRRLLAVCRGGSRAGSVRLVISVTGSYAADEWTLAWAAASTAL